MTIETAALTVSDPHLSIRLAKAVVLEEFQPGILESLSNRLVQEGVGELDQVVVMVEAYAAGDDRLGFRLQLHEMLEECPGLVDVVQLAVMGGLDAQTVRRVVRRRLAETSKPGAA